MYLFITIPVQFIVFFGVTCTVSFQLVYWGTYTHIHPKGNLPVYLHASLWSNNKDLPVSTTTSVPANRCTRFMTLPVHFNTVFLITVKIDPSTFLLFYMSTDVPVHHYNCAVYFFFFGITRTMTFQLVYWGTYTQINPKLNLRLPSCFSSV